LQIEVKDTGGDVLCETEFEMLLRKWKKD